MSASPAGRPEPLPTADRPGTGGLRLTSSFEVFYRANVQPITRYFARRSTDPQMVADLTSETFVRAVSSAHSFDGRGSQRAWAFAIARAVYAQYQAQQIGSRNTISRLGGRVLLQEDQLEELIDHIDAEGHARQLLARVAKLRDGERSAIELVDLGGLSVKEAARVLDVPPGTLRVRLFRARSQLRKENHQDEQL